MLADKQILFERLIVSTIDFLNNRKQTNLDLAPITRKPDKENIWNQICLDLYGDVNYNRALNIFRMWQRDTMKYSSTVRNILKVKSISIIENDFETFIVSIDSSDWKKLLTACIRIYNNRSKFSNQFDNFLAQKLQDLGLKCWIKCKFNWFSKFQSRKKVARWRGIYKCQDVQCKNKFEAAIYNENELQNQQEILVFVKYTVRNSHSSKLFKKLSYRGESREQQGIELLAFKTTNVLNENLVHNEHRTNQNG